MTLNISLLQMNGKPKTVKEAIVSLLISEWPLTAKQIFNRIEKKFGLIVSYQAVYKILKLLKEEEIVKKNENKFTLNSEWVKKTKEFSETLEKTHLQKNFLDKSGLGNFELNSIYDSDMFLLDFILDNLPEKREKMAWQWSHYWIPLFLSMKEYQKIKGLQEAFDVYSIVRGKSLIDKWCSDFWQKQGAKTKFGVKLKSETDTVAFGDFVIQVHYPPKSLKKMDDFFNKAKQIEDIDVNFLFQHLFLEKTKIIMVINKNKELADRIKKEAIEMFEGEKK